MAETFRQYIKIRTFLGYRPKEILLELQNAFGDEAPNYASVQRWSKRFRDAVDSPLGSPFGSQINFETQESQSKQRLESNNNINEDIDENKMQKQLNANAKQTESTHTTTVSRRSRTSRSRLDKPRRFINE